MKIKQLFGKVIAVAGASAIAVVGLRGTTHADTIANDTKVVTVKANKDDKINVYKDYEKETKANQTLDENTSWKVIKTAKDAEGNKWYDLGYKQWVKASDVVKGWHDDTTGLATADQTSTSANTTQNTTTDNSNSNTSQTYTAYSTNLNSSTTTSNSNTSQSTTTNTSSSSSSSEASAKAWIANKESGGSYSARNGQYIGKYQLSASYLNGDYSAANQEKVADQYVKSRYGSWTAAKAFWLANGWY
ncbi:MAG: hypothetical protein Q3960_03660 [Lactobacillus sp.]|nr:hypothetical protein [Lactobacillus sp.]